MSCLTRPFPVLKHGFTVNKSSQFFIFGDQSWPVESLAKALPEDTPVSVWVDGKGWMNSKRRLNGNKLTAATAAENCVFKGTTGAVAIVGFQDPQTSQKVAHVLRGKNAGIKILQVGSKRLQKLSKENRTVDWSHLLSPGVDTEILLLSIQQRVEELRNFLKGSEKIALLLQEDPDPDGLAAALALRKVLGRNSQTATIVSFGSISRPENAAMARLLDIEIEKVNPEQLESFDKVVLIDCQPSFFKGKKIRADAIIDHHPRPLHAKRLAAFEEIREDLGSISTLMTQYLRSAGVEISQRLATALLYGIKSDTLILNREVSEEDLEAFVYLYRRINGNILRRIERPELPLNYLKALRVGLKYLAVSNGISVLPLGRITKDEWVPQAADFALQIEGSQWAIGCGIFNEKIIISGRNTGFVEHCGDLFKKLFNEAGCAGGHRSMAKAIIHVDDWLAAFGPDTLLAPQMAEFVKSKIIAALSAE